MNTNTSDNPQAWTSDFMDGCHEMTLEHLKPYLGKMFENCNLAMLEFADKAESSTAQIRFMEAGNIIKRNRENLERIFFHELAQGFSQFKHTCSQITGSYSSTTFGSAVSEDQMTLISKEDTDIQVAIQNMVASASLGSTLELTGIKQRLSVLNNSRKLEENQIPAGPHALADAFHKAAKELVLEHESRLIVYLLFDRFILSNTTALYEAYNERLLKAGLLQNLKYEARKNPDTPDRQRAVQASKDESHTTSPRRAGTDQSLSDELFDSILNLMSQRNPRSTPAPQNAAPQTEIVTAIHNVQQNIDNNASASAPALSGTTPSVDHMVANLTAEREQLFNGLDRRRLPAADTQMIDLVGMMFEYMLNDDDIPNVAKAELSRLHTPYLKVAIMDNTFFTDNEHTAHRLLNELAQAGARWVVDDKLERGIFPCMRKIISRIMLDFRNDLGIFSELLDILHSSIKDLEHKADRIEDHSRQAAEGKEKLELARLCSDTVINDIVGKYTVADAIRKMLGDTWQDKLTFIFLREPSADQSDSWRLAVQTIESILWCTEPRTTPEEQASLRNCYLETHKQIKQSLDTLSAYGASNIAADMALIREHTQAATESTDHTAVTVSDVSNDPQDAPTPARTGVFSEYTTEQTSDTASDEDESGCVTPESVAAMEKLDAAPFGTWFSLQIDIESAPVQAKLSWHSTISGNYMFVDSMGSRTAILHRCELVRMMMSGQAAVINTEQRPFMQRAMDTIRRVLGGEKTSQTLGNSWSN